MSTPRAFDALIAATAIARGLPLYTVNPADFLGIDGLVVRAIPVSDTTTSAAGDLDIGH